MKIAVGSDHGGYFLKEAIKKYLKDKGHKVKDFGTFSTDSCDYPDFGKELAQAVADGKFSRGVLICGTGIGMSMVANKVTGIRAALCTDGYMAQMARAHNNANILCMGERVIGEGLAKDILEKFLTTKFEGDRHRRRVRKIMALD